MTENTYMTDEEIAALVEQDPSIDKAKEKIEAIKSAIERAREKSDKLRGKREKLDEKMDDIRSQLDQLEQQQTELVSKQLELIHMRTDLENEAMSFTESNTPHEAARFDKIEQIEQMIPEYIEARKRLIKEIQNGTPMSELIEERKTVFEFIERVNKVYYSKGATHG